MRIPLKIALAGGGTGGHLYPAMNLLKVFEMKYDCRALFFGTIRGIEAAKVPQAGYSLHLLDVRGFQRRLTRDNLMFPIRLLRAMRQSRKALQAFKPDLVIGSGGYVMGPVLKQAARMGIPYILQEQNSYPGVTTRLLAAGARAVFVAYEEARPFLSKQATIISAGNPLFVPETLPEKDKALTALGLEPQKYTWLVFGGSQGARSINQAMQKIVQKGLPENVQVLWQTGTVAYESFKRLGGKRANTVSVVPFIDDMWQAYAAADFVMCRAGAMSLSELAVAGLPAILVPLSSAAGNHQYKNAKSTQEHGAAIMLEDNDDLARQAGETIRKWLDSPKGLAKMAVKMRSLARPDAAEKIVDYIQEKILGYNN